jgi:hypothetical protein
MPGGVKDMINIFNKIRFNNLFPLTKQIKEISKLKPIKEIAKLPLAIIEKKKKKGWMEQKYENLQTAFWNKIIFKSFISIGKGIGLIFPQVAIITKLVQAIEVMGPALTIAAGKIAICSCTRSLGWITGTIPWEKSPTLLLDSVPNSIPAAIPFKEELVEIVSSAFEPELSEDLENQLAGAAEKLGVGGVVKGGLLVSIIGVIVKGMLKLNEVSVNLNDVPNIESIEYWLAGALVVGLMSSVYGLYRWYREPTRYKISEDLKEEILDKMEPDKKEVVNQLIEIVNKK